jgi:pimeloyl-ACP methyl ester carboxylesterase
MIRRIASLSLAVLVAASTASAIQAQSSTSTASAAARGKNASQTAHKATIVLVHGAFADGTGWHKVIALLQRDGYEVIAVQNPLSSFSNDIETTRRVIDGRQTPVVLVGHSYGGAVITEAAASRPNVKALVFIAAFAPDANEPIGAFLEKYPNTLGPALKPDAAGFLYVDAARFRDVFADDLSAAEVNVAAAAQKPIIGTAFGASPTQASWKTVPSFYLVTQRDRALNPELQRFYAKRIGATTVESDASHAVYLSRPGVVAKLIEQAAEATAK